MTEIIVSDMSEIIVSDMGEIDVITHEEEDSDETKQERKSVNAAGKPKGKRGRPKTVKMVKVVDNDENNKPSSTPSSPIKKRGRKPKNVQSEELISPSSSAPSSPLLFKKRGRKPKKVRAVSSTSSSPLPIKKRGRKTKSLAPSSGTGTQSSVMQQRTMADEINFIEQDEVIRPEDLEGFEDVETFSVNMSDKYGHDHGWSRSTVPTPTVPVINEINEQKEEPEMPFSKEDPAPAPIQKDSQTED